jgi:hypothetical protein
MAGAIGQLQPGLAIICSTSTPRPAAFSSSWNPKSRDAWRWKLAAEAKAE